MSLAPSSLPASNINPTLFSAIQDVSLAPNLLLYLSLIPCSASESGFKLAQLPASDPTLSAAVQFVSLAKLAHFPASDHTFFSAVQFVSPAPSFFTCL